LSRLAHPPSSGDFGEAGASRSAESSRSLPGAERVSVPACYSVHAREHLLVVADLVLTKSFYGRGETARQVAYDPAGNRWLLTDINPIGRVTGPVAMIHDSRRDLVWCMSGGRMTYVLRLNQKTLRCEEALEPAKDKNG